MKQITLLDGGMGTMLQRRQAPMGKVPEELNITHPEILQEIHLEYAEAGSDIIYANTFSANRYKLKNSRYSVEELVSAGIRNARAAAETVAASTGRTIRVALDIGPIGKLLEPNGEMTFEEAYDIYREMLLAGAAAGADLVVIETSTDLLEVKAAVLATREHTNLPVWTTMTFEQNGRTFTGVTLAAAAITLTALGVDAVGINCSLGPAEILPMAAEMRRYTHLPMIVKPNAGLPNLTTGQYDVEPEEFAGLMEEMVELGVEMIGGCCGTTPEFIAGLRQMLTARSQKEQTGEIETTVVEKNKISSSYLCSATQVLQVEGITVVGERINPTGKKAFQEALRSRNISYVLDQAVEQVEAGAQILDVNVGLPGIDERQMMVDVVKELQAVVDVPLQIDSTNAEVLEAALRIYNGKPLVNSVNGEQAVLDRILPLVKKYGAGVIGLTLDETGIPDRAEDRLVIARRIVEAAERYGIAREDIYIDCLVLTASVKQAEVLETLRAMELVKSELGVKTLLGISNISFGMPNRDAINTAFLTMAMERGVDLAIMNPNNPAMMGAVDAFRVLHNQDTGAEHYVEKYKDYQKNKKIAPTVKDELGEPAAEKLRHAVLNGMKKNASSYTEELLQSQDPMAIVNEILIPALDQVGTEFEQGVLFLPQLLQSAGAAQNAFAVIKEYMAAHAVDAGISKGRIILATVKGDVHDIGKNIVKVVLENYGYEVIDLGKDVPVETVVEETRRTGAPLVGLSALMTTTVVNMEATIQALRAAGLPCQIMVGGAVLTPEYAKRMGADYYAKDAKQSADIARQIFGQ